MEEQHTNAEFCEKVRAMYLEMFGADALETDDQPFLLGGTVVAFEVEYYDGDSSTILVRDCSPNTAAGLHTRAAHYYVQSPL